jgi:hypothetical protein
MPLKREITDNDYVGALPKRSKSTFYVNEDISVLMEDTNEGILKINYRGTPTRILYTRPMPGTRVQHHNRKVLGKYTKLYFDEGDDVAEDTAKIIAGW